LREAVRSAIGQASQGADAFVDMDRIARELASPVLDDPWRAVQCTENHDIVYRDRGQRLPRLADGANSRSWYARSRSRVALGLTLTAVGIPHLFMGQEFLEDQQWHDEPGSAFQIGWDGLLQGEPSRTDFVRFTQELCAVRRRLSGLRGTGLHVFHVHNTNRILAFHRWVPGNGDDVVVIASLSEATYEGYEIGFPSAGYWREVFNSDVYDHWVNPWVVGNGGGIHANSRSVHGLPASAQVILPANSLIIFAR
jgi:1,4-alpha-glucan branching enzyme